MDFGTFSFPESVHNADVRGFIPLDEIGVAVTGVVFFGVEAKVGNFKGVIDRVECNEFFLGEGSPFRERVELGVAVIVRKEGNFVGVSEIVLAGVCWLTGLFGEGTSIPLREEVELREEFVLNILLRLGNLKGAEG